jgi:hypothetical protein
LIAHVLYYGIKNYLLTEVWWRGASRCLLADEDGADALKTAAPNLRRDRHS